MLGLGFHGWVSVLVTVAVFAVLQLRRGAPTDLLFLGGLVAVTLLGVIRPEQALAGFANPAVLTVGALFVVAAGLQSTGVLDRLGYRLLGTARTANSALLRLTLCVLAASAFINNTAVVAMAVPVVLDWCRRRGVSPSRLLIPVSYLAILGGTCTLIGTSTNIIGDGLLRDEYARPADSGRPADALPEPQTRNRFHEHLRPMTLFELGRVGLPCALVGSLYLLLVGRRRLPDRRELVEQLDEQRREYLVEMLVQPDCPLIGKTVEAAGLRHLRGLFLLEIDRQGETLTPVTPEDVIRAGDRLIFTGVVTTIVDLEKTPGLVPAADTTYVLQPRERHSRRLTEAVLSRSSPLVGRTVREAQFRQRYGAAVVAVHRNGLRLPRKIGDIVLAPGDTLLLQTRSDFAGRFRHSRDFYLVADVQGYQPRRHDRAWLAAGLMLVLVLWLVGGTLLRMWFGGWLPEAVASPAVAATVIAGLIIAGRCLPLDEARAAIDLQVLITIAAALGLGTALKESGAAEAIAGALLGSTEMVPPGLRPYALLAILYLITVLLTETISNNVVAAMMFPLAVATAAAGGYSPRPFVMTILLGASLSFLTPIGYQTNLMVLGPGGYQPRDYLRVGWPLAVAVGATILLLAPRVWSPWL